MNLSVLLLCGFAALQFSCSSKMQPSGRARIKIGCCDFSGTRRRSFEIIKCPWMASSQTLMFITRRRPTFEETMEDLMNSLRVRFSNFHGLPVLTPEYLIDIVNEVSPQVTDIRDTLWQLLFYRKDHGNTRPPTSEEIQSICSMSQDVFEAIKLRIPGHAHIARSVFESFLARFVLPAVLYWRHGDTNDCWFRSGIELSQDYIMRYITEMRLVEPAALAGRPSQFLFETFHPRLVVYLQSGFKTWRQLAAFKEMLLAKDLANKVDLEEAISTIQLEHYQLYNYVPQFQVYLVVRREGVRSLELVEDMMGHVSVGANNAWSLSPRQIRGELYHAASRIKGGSTVQYYPKKAVTRASIPSGALLVSDVIGEIFAQCLKIDPKTEIHKVCKWAWYHFSPCLFPDLEECVPSLLRDIFIPSGKVIQLILASLVTAVSRPTTYGSEDVAIERLCMFVRKRCPAYHRILTTSSVDDLVKDNSPDHFFEHPSAHLVYGALGKMISHLQIPPS